MVPISVSLSDVPHYLAEFALLAACTPAEYAARPAAGQIVPQGWVTGTELIHALYRIGAFPDNVNTTDENYTSQLFRDKQSAMQVDGSWFANSLPASGMDTTVVLPFPAEAEGAGGVLGGVSMGFYLTRHVWEDELRRDAAVHLLAYLATGENAVTLGGFQFSGKLLASAVELTGNPLYTPVQDQMSQKRATSGFGSSPASQPVPLPRRSSGTA